MLPCGAETTTSPPLPLSPSPEKENASSVPARAISPAADRSVIAPPLPALPSAALLEAAARMSPISIISPESVRSVTAPAFPKVEPESILPMRSRLPDADENVTWPLSIWLERELISPKKLISPDSEAISTSPPEPKTESVAISA